MEDWYWQIKRQENDEQEQVTVFSKGCSSILLAVIFFWRCCCFLKAIWTKIVCPCHYERYITYGVSAIAAKCGIRLRQERVLYLSNGEPHLSVSWRTIAVDHGKIDDCTCNQDNGLILSARTYVQWRCQKSCKALLYVEILLSKLNQVQLLCFDSELR